VEAFADAVGLRALGLGARVIDVLDREIQLVLVPFGIAAKLAAAVSQRRATATVGTYKCKACMFAEPIRTSSELTPIGLK
jgi:hypothetical protein